MSEHLLREIHRDVKALRDDHKTLSNEQVEQGKCLARIDERTMNQDKRIDEVRDYTDKRFDRTDRRNVGVSGATTVMGGGLLIALKAYFGF